MRKIISEDTLAVRPEEHSRDKKKQQGRHAETSAGLGYENTAEYEYGAYEQNISRSEEYHNINFLSAKIVRSEKKAADSSK